MAERSIAAVLKTVEAKTSGGSNPSLSARSLHKSLIVNLQSLIKKDLRTRINDF